MQFEIIRIARAEDAGPLHPLIGAYFDWVVPPFNAQNGLSIDAAEVARRTLDGLDGFLPPDGAIAMGRDAEGAAVGMVFVHRIRPDACEVKRLFVLPRTRGSGLGRALIREATEAAREMGARALYLDTTAFMEAAHRLYRAEGFVEVEPYPESEHSDAQAGHVLFMKRDLA